MKKTLRILSTVLLIPGILILLLLLASVLFSDRITSLAIDAVNERVSTKLQTGDVKLSFLKGFPEASVELKDVVLYSSKGFRHSDFPDINTDILLTAERLTFDFRIPDLLKNNYRIESISIRNGRLTLLTDSSGSVSYDFTSGEKTEPVSSPTIDLNRIMINNVTIDYINLSSRVEFNMIVPSGRLKSRLSGALLDVKAEGSTRINRLGINDFYISKSFGSDFRLDLLSDNIRTFISSGSFSVDDYKFSIEGEIAENNSLDLRFKGNSVDLAGIRTYLPPALAEHLTGYNPSGTLDLEGTVKGEANRTGIPDLVAGFSIKNGSVSYSGSSVSASEINLTGSFSYAGTGPERMAILEIPSAELRLGSEKFKAAGSVRGFNNPLITLRAEGMLIPSEISEFFHLNFISSSSGSAYVTVELKGSPGKKEKYTLKDLLDLEFSSEINLNNLRLGLNKDKFLIYNASGKLKLSDTSYAEKLSFTYNDHRFLLSGKFYDLPLWIAGANVVLRGDADVTCDHFDPEKLSPPSQTELKGRTKTNKFRIPDDIILEARLNADRFTYREFSASGLRGTIALRPGFIDIKSLSFNSMDGVISGNGLLYANPDKSLISRGDFQLSSVSIEKAFLSFRNFGQDFIRAENLSGKLSGSLSVLIPFDTLFRTVTGSITAEGNYVITGGELKNFEPVKALSKFIELSELEDIRFDRLENDFFIRNNALYIPQMEVRSSAANLTVSGRHGFDDHYEYHVRILLSQLLSQKFKKSGKSNTEFGAVKDDGLGRTSLLLKIEDRDNDVRVSYDVRAAGTEIKNDIKAERQTLKTILNQEYGWFKNDTAVKQKTETKSEPRFRISWGDSDTIKPVQEKTPAKKESPFRNIIKKK